MMMMRTITTKIWESRPKHQLQLLSDFRTSPTSDFLHYLLIYFKNSTDIISIAKNIGKAYC